MNSEGPAGVHTFMDDMINHVECIVSTEGEKKKSSMFLPIVHRITSFQVRVIMFILLQLIL